MWEVIRTLVREGATLLLTTQYLEEADELADTIAVVDHGKIIARGTADELKAQVGGERIEVVVHDRTRIDDARRILSGIGDRRGGVRRAHPASHGTARTAARNGSSTSSATSTRPASRSTTSASDGPRSTTSSSP